MAGPMGGRPYILLVQRSSRGFCLSASQVFSSIRLLGDSECLAAFVGFGVAIKDVWTPPPNLYFLLARIVSENFQTE